MVVVSRFPEPSGTDSWRSVSALFKSTMMHSPSTPEHGLTCSSVYSQIHVEDIPGSEWEIILADRCGLPPSHCKLLVKVLHELQVQRQSSRLFLGKNGAISPRDLLRWAGRKPQGKQQLAEEG